jgi:dihydrofolate reductase
MRINIIASIGEHNRVIGRNNKLPWSVQLRPDMKHFVDLTSGHPVIMGRNTWESIPEKYRPLPGRENIIVSRQLRGKRIPGAWRAYSLDCALEIAGELVSTHEAFVIGGGQLYAEALPRAHRLYLTLVDEDAGGDRFFPEYPDFTKVIERHVVPGFEPRLTYLTLERA